MAKKDMDRRTANARVQKVLGTDRAYVDKRNGRAAVWLKNRDRRLDPRFEGPLLAATGEDYRHAVLTVEQGMVFENAAEALALLKDPVAAEVAVKAESPTEPRGPSLTRTPSFNVVPR
jgi:hypothetical protein